VLAVLLGLGVAVSYGTGDFFGGVATSRSRPALIIVWSQVAGLVGIVVLAASVGGRLDAHDLLFGAAAGVCGVPFYRALSGGRMAVVAPTSAVTAAIVPVVVGLLGGERLGLLGFGGVAAALTGVVLVSSGEGEAMGSPTTRSVRADAALAIAGGVGFGVVFALLGQVGDNSGLWPVLAQRGTSVTVLATILLLRRELQPLPATARIPAGIAGVLDTLANALFVLSARAGDLAVVGVLASLYPVTTVLLAARVLGEHIRPVQIAGIALAIAGAALLAL
jgi:drug/metabolite transporter (DMT)-like permease